MQGVIKVLVQKNLKFQIATEHGGKLLRQVTA